MIWGEKISFHGFKLNTPVLSNRCASHQQYCSKYPENPQILKILIQTHYGIGVRNISY